MCDRRVLFLAFIQTLEEATGMFPTRGDAVLTHLIVTEIDEAGGNALKFPFALFGSQSYKSLPNLSLQIYKAKGNKKDFTDLTHSPSVQLCSLFSRKENSNLHSS